MCGAACLYVQAASSGFLRLLPSPELLVPYLRVGLWFLFLSRLSCISHGGRSRGTSRPRSALEPGPGEAAWCPEDLRVFPPDEETGAVRRLVLRGI